MILEFGIKSGNDALTGPGAVQEVGRLLRQTADRIEAGQEGGRLTEYNGNACGSWFIDTESQGYACEDCGTEAIEEAEGQICSECGCGLISEVTQ